MKDLSVLKPPFDEQKKRFLKLKENLQNDMNGGTGEFPPGVYQIKGPAGFSGLATEQSGGNTR